MGASITASANDILNRVAVETGSDAVADPFASTQKTFVQLRALLNVAGEELCQILPWQFLVREHQITTSDTDSGDYPLPDDFLYMIPQTGWERAENVPLGGPLTPQDWQYLEGRDLVSSTIYASFRLGQSQFRIFPQPPPNALDIRFEYVSRNWVYANGDPDLPTDVVTAGGDVPLFDRTLLSRMLKVKWLEAKGFDATKAQADLNQSFALLAARDTTSGVLSLNGGRANDPRLLSGCNIPDTNFGGA